MTAAEVFGEDRITVKEALHIIIAKTGRTQNDLADQMGVSHTSLANWLHGRKTPNRFSHTKVMLLCEREGVPAPRWMPANPEKKIGRPVNEEAPYMAIFRIIALRLEGKTLVDISRELNVHLNYVRTMVKRGKRAGIQFPEPLLRAAERCAGVASEETCTRVREDTKDEAGGSAPKDPLRGGEATG